ncbi:MAG: DUF192 domain-containing protein [Candidatus Staskawiczbacteria bacterium]|nr:DUF192 domain-containing protein [Candidatus Staskawiczbacteria bacterium]
MKMILEIFLVIIVVILLICSFFYYAETLIAPAPNQNQLGSVCFNDNCFQVELAKTKAERDRGLMYRKELGKDKGMLFVFDKSGIYPFWMKDTLIPLDMIWIDSNSKVVFIAHNVQPCKSLICPSVFPAARAKYVLEVNSGICQDLGLKLGDVLKISLD